MVTDLGFRFTTLVLHSHTKDETNILANPLNSVKCLYLPPLLGWHCTWATLRDEKKVRWLSSYLLPPCEKIHVNFLFFYSLDWTSVLLDLLARHGLWLAISNWTLLIVKHCSRHLVVCFAHFFMCTFVFAHFLFRWLGQSNRCQNRGKRGTST